MPKNIKQKRTTYTLKKKQDVIKMKMESPKITQDELSRIFGMLKGTINSILKKKDELLLLGDVSKNNILPNKET